jgi:hypothetical protein
MDSVESNQREKHHTHDNITHQRYDRTMKTMFRLHYCKMTCLPDLGNEECKYSVIIDLGI